MPPAERPRVAETVALGLLHGPAELLPVSSSAHVALIPRLLGWRHAALAPDVRKAVEVALHAGTAAALAGGLRPRGVRDAAWLAVAATPAAAAGLALERPIEQRLGTPRSIALGLLAGAAALAWTDARPQSRRRRPGWGDAAALGLAQAAALAPGVSRHGAALAAARARGLPRPAAHHLSRRAGHPVLAAATALKGFRLAQDAPEAATARALAAGAAASWLSTRAAARVLPSAAAAPLWPFAAYRAALAGVALASVPRMARARRPLSGRVVAITGAARGIGRATAAELARRGARVAIGDRDAAAAEEAAAAIGAGVTAFAVDVTDRAAFAGFLDAVEHRVGPLDALVNNAGIALVGPFDAEDPAATLRQVEVNLLAVVAGTQLAVQRMRPRGRGHVVNVASSAGRVAIPGIATYSATKHGVVGFTEAVRHELRGSGIDLSIVMPGPVETEMIAGTRRARGVEVIQPEDVARAVADGLERPRFEIFVPRSLGMLYRLTAGLPVAPRQWFARAVEADRIYTEVDRAQRAGYDARLSGPR